MTATVLAVLILLVGCQSAARPQTTSLEFESFSPIIPYVTGSETVILVGTVRNTGKATILAGAAGLRIYALAGLDYTEGDTSPRLPELQPDQAATFRWKLAPSRAEGPLAAALAIEEPGQPARVRVITIPRLAADPVAESAAVSPTPIARTGQGVSVIENNTVRARVLRTQGGTPLLILSSHSPGGWRTIGASVPLAEVLSAEGGQRPWWEVFKLEDEAATVNLTEATLKMSGRIGVRWRGTISLTLRQNSSVLDVRLQLAPLRRMLIFGLRLSPLYAGAGSFGSAISEALEPEPSGPNVVAAVRWGEITVGTLRPASPPFDGWETVGAPPVRDAAFHMLASETMTRGDGIPLDPGALLELKARLFAITPSLSVRDALRVTFPPAPLLKGDSRTKPIPPSGSQGTQDDAKLAVVALRVDAPDARPRTNPGKYAVRAGAGGVRVAPCSR